MSAPSLYARKSERELNALLRGFGFSPLTFDGENPERFQYVLEKAEALDAPFLIMQSVKGLGCPAELDGEKISGNYLSHQIPLPLAKTDKTQLALLENWLKSYNFEELYTEGKGFNL